MSEVVIAGIGQTTAGEHWETSVRELAFYALEEAIEDAGGLRPQALYVGNMLSAMVSGQAHLGALVADFAGLRGIDATVVNAAGASGGAALRMGYLAVKSGFIDAAIVVGVEKMTDKVGADIEEAIASTTDSDYEAVHGLTIAAQAAMLMRRYLYETGAPRESFGEFPVLAHANGVGNPKAMFRKAIRPELYQRAGMISEPLNMFDASPDADGSAAMILTRPELLPPNNLHERVSIAGSSVTTDTLALHDRKDILDFRAVRLSVDRACRQASITPDDVDLYELYDAFSIYAVLSLEAAGYAPRGEGWKLPQSGDLGLNGRLPILTMGGLKARGNPWGAVGVYQAVEAVLQLRGKAGINQVEDPEYAMIQCLGGPASTSATHILRKISESGS